MAEETGGAGRTGRARAEPFSPRSFGSEDDADRWAQGAWSGWPEGLSQGEAQAIFGFQDSYTGDFNEAINTSLRGGDTSDLGFTRSQLARIPEVVRQIDSALDKGRVPEDVVAYRGLNSSANVERMWNEATPGASFADPAFASTSLSRSWVRDFFGGRNSVEIRIRVPRGSKGAYLNSRRSNPYPEQMELLLPRNTRMRVVDRRTDENGQRIIEVEAETP